MNLATSHFRRRRVERAYLARSGVAPETNPNEALDATMHDAMLHLPERQRAAIVLRFYEDLSQTQIAARTGIPLGTVKGRMVDALTRLRKMIEEER